MHWDFLKYKWKSLMGNKIFCHQGETEPVANNQAFFFLFHKFWNSLTNQPTKSQVRLKCNVPLGKLQEALNWTKEKKKKHDNNF